MHKKQPLKTNKKVIILITNINVFICAVLFVSMIIFASVYIIRSQYFKLKAEDDIPIDTLLILKQGNTTVSDTFNISFITPEFIGFNFDKGVIGITGNAEVTSDIYLTTSDYIKYVFGNNYLCDMKDSADGDAIWNSCLSGNNYIYIKYPSALPSDVIIAFFNSEKTTSAVGLSDDGVVFIREIFLMFNYYGEELYAIHAVSKDDNGNIAVFEYNYINNEPRQYFKIEGILSYYGNNLFLDYDFAEKYESISNYKLPLKDTALIFDKDISAHDIIVSNINDNKFSGVSADLVLKQFGYNPDKLNGFINTDGTLVYIETHGELEILSDKIIYTANDNNGGIDISDYLSYGINNGDYDIFEIIKATGIIIDSIRKIDTGFIGGDAGLRISDISYDNENNNLIIKYSYYYDNIVISSETGDFDACRFKIKDNKIIEVYINSIQIKGSSDKRMNYPQLWMLDKIGNIIESTSPGDIRLEYHIQPGVDGTYPTQWIYTTESNSVTYKDKSGTDKNEVINNDEMD